MQEQQLGTGHAVRCGLEALPSGLAGAVVVTYGDVPLLEPATLQALLAEHAAAGAAVTLLTAELADPTGYGRVLRGAGRRGHRHRRAAPTRRPSSAPIREINSGVYAFDAAFLAAGLGRVWRSHNARASST